MVTFKDNSLGIINEVLKWQIHLQIRPKILRLSYYERRPSASRIITKSAAIGIATRRTSTTISETSLATLCSDLQKLKTHRALMSIARISNILSMRMKKKKPSTGFSKRWVKYGTNKDFDDVVLCGIIYNVIFSKKEAIKASKNKSGKRQKENEEDQDKDNETEPRVYPVPVFKVRGYRNERIEKKTDGGQKDGSIENAYYIDNSARVYYGFADYLANNTLPSCTMVLPKDGRYQGDPYMHVNANVAIPSAGSNMTNVWIEVHRSPASAVSKKVLQGCDIATTLATVASMGVGIAAMATPIGAGVAIAGAVGAALGGVWTIGRSSQQLADRGQHRESINVTNRKALSAWIGIAGGTMCLVASGGTALLARAIRIGATVGRDAMIAFEAVQIGNMIINGVGMGFKSYGIYADYTEESGVDLLTAHAFFFCNSVINARLAKSMIESTQRQLMKDYEISLRNKRHRKEFQRMDREKNAAEIVEDSSDEEIIRGINKINNEEDFLQGIANNYRTLSLIYAKASFTSTDDFSVNGIMIVNPQQFSKLPKDVRSDLVKPPKSVPGKDQHAYHYFTTKMDAVLKEFCSNRSEAIAQTSPVKIGDFTNVLRDLRKLEDRDDIFLKLLVFGCKILQALPRHQEITFHDTLAFIGQFLWDYLKLNLREMRPGMLIEAPSTQTLLKELMPVVFRSVDEKLDVWVEAFICWVEAEFPQLINFLFFHYHKLR